MFESISLGAVFLLVYLVAMVGFLGAVLGVLEVAVLLCWPCFEIENARVYAAVICWHV